MKLNRKSAFARFYLFAGDDWDLPGDFCPFFWGLVGRILKIAIGVGIFLFIVGFLIFTIVHVGMIGWRHPTISLIVSGSSAVIATGFWLVYRQGVTSAVSDFMNIVSTKADAVKNRYCPRIDWQ